MVPLVANGTIGNRFLAANDIIGAKFTIGENVGTIGSPNGTIGKPNGTIGKPNGTIGKPNGTIGKPNGANSNIMIDTSYLFLYSYFVYVYFSNFIIW